MSCHEHFFCRDCIAHTLTMMVEMDQFPAQCPTCKADGPGDLQAASLKAAATSAAAAAAGRPAAASVLCAGARRPARSAAVSAPEPPFAAVPARPPAARPTLA